MREDILERPPTAVQQRLFDTQVEMAATESKAVRSYLHAVLCMTGIPYRTPKVRTHQRENGDAWVEVRAGTIGTDEHPLPAGPRARIILLHVMTEAVLTQTPNVLLGGSLRGFLKTLGIAVNGRDGRTIREQLNRLSACTMRIGWRNGDAVQGPIIEGIDVFPSGEGRAPWSTHAQLTPQFFESLLEHAVPLDRRALAALKHNAGCMDTYTWLAHRLCRIQTDSTVRISWKQLHAQLGGGVKSVKHWKANFLGRNGGKGALGQVLAVYSAAAEAVTVTREGIELVQAEPPTPRLPRALQRAGSSKESDLLFILSDDYSTARAPAEVE